MDTASGSDAANKVTCSLVKFNVTGSLYDANYVATVSSLDGEKCTFDDTINVGVETIDNNNAAYYLTAHIPPQSDPYSLYLRYVIITYELPT